MNREIISGNRDEKREVLSNIHSFGIAGVFDAKLLSDKPIMFDEKANLLGQAYLPGFSYQGSLSQNEEVFRIIHKESNDGFFHQSDGQVEIHENWEGNLPLDFYHLLYGMSRKELVNKELYPVHSISIGNDGEHLLVVGHSGFGKTSVLLKMVGEHGAKVFSTNKTVVSFQDDGLNAVSGTKAVTARDIVFQRYLPNFDAARYQDRAAVILTDEMYEDSEAVSIKGVVIAREDSAVSEFDQISGASAMHKLYPFFMDQMNADTILLDGSAVLDGSLPPQAGRDLAQKLSNVTKNIPTFAITGSVDFIAQALSRL